MQRHRTIRRLKIGWTGLFAVLCGVLIVLWVRSYTWCDIFCVRIDNAHNQWLESLDGRLSYDGTASLSQNQLFRWILHPAERWRRGPFPTTKPILGFCWSLGGNPLPVIPHWFPAFVFAALAVLPWFGWRRFSLRTLLIIMTLAAVMLGAIAYFLSMAPPPQTQTMFPMTQPQTDVSDEELFGPAF